MLNRAKNKRNDSGHFFRQIRCQTAYFQENTLKIVKAIYINNLTVCHIACLCCFKNSLIYLFARLVRRYLGLLTAVYKRFEKIFLKIIFARKAYELGFWHGAC